MSSNPASGVRSHRPPPNEITCEIELFDWQSSVQSGNRVVELARKASLHASVKNLSSPKFDHPDDGPPRPLQMLEFHKTTGDFYHGLLLPDGRFSFFLGDIMGHGFAEAQRVLELHLLLEQLQTDPRFIKAHGSASDVLRFLDNEIIRTSTFIGEVKNDPLLVLANLIYDPKTHELQICNSGLPDVVVQRQDGTTQIFSSDGNFVGFDSDFFDSANPQTQRVILKKGDEVYAMTDGVTDAKVKPNSTSRHDYSAEDSMMDDCRGGNTILSIIRGGGKSCVNKASEAIFSKIGQIVDDTTLVVFSPF